MDKLLATVVDFEKKLKALQRRGNEWSDYYICVFGYCGKCRAVTPYKSHGGLEGGSNECLKCGKNIEWSEPHSERVPQETKEGVYKEIKRRNTRAGQLQFFYELLEKTITEQKGVARSAEKTVRKLAALRRS